MSLRQPHHAATAELATASRGAVTRRAQRGGASKQSQSDSSAPRAKPKHLSLGRGRATASASTAVPAHNLIRSAVSAPSTNHAPRTTPHTPPLTTGARA